MGSLQEELKKKVLKNDKFELKKENVNHPTPDRSNPNKNIIHQASRKKIVHQGPKVIKCPDCGLGINSLVFKQHQIEVHNKRQKLDVGTNKPFAEKKEHQHRNEAIEIKNKEVEEFKPVIFNNFDFIKISSASDFKKPEPWIEKYSHHMGSENGDEIIIGLDLGTSFTKSVIDYKGDKYAVDWSGISNFSDSHTLPTEMSIDESNNLFIGRCPNSKKIITALKVALLKIDDPINLSNDVKVNLVNYLKIVFKYIRAWWFHNYQDLFDNKINFYWNINVGLPAKNKENKHLVALYEKIVREGWKRSFNDRSNEVQDNVFYVAVLPEFSCQINTYLRSPKKSHGLHLLIDVGAGTTDISCFNVTRDISEETDIALYGMEWTVTKFGTHDLNYSRYELIQDKSSFSLDATLDTEEFINSYTVEKSQIQSLDSLFAKSLGKQIRIVLSRTKSGKYSKAPEWHSASGVRTFICGGAYQCNVIKEAFINAQSGTVHNKFNLLEIPLDKPDNLNELKTVKEFHRVSVAYGLSFNELNQPKVPGDLVSDEEKIKITERQIIDWDDG